MQHIAKFETHKVSCGTKTWVVDCPHARSVMDESSLVVLAGKYEDFVMSNPVALAELCIYHEQKEGCGCAVWAGKLLAQRN